MVSKVVPIAGTKTLKEIQDELAIRNDTSTFWKQPTIAGYWDSAWGVSISGTAKPTRWQRYWHKVLLGWRWRDA